MSELLLPVFSWRSFQAPDLTFGSVTHLDLIGTCCEAGVLLHSLHMVVQPRLGSATGGPKWKYKNPHAEQADSFHKVGPPK